MIRLNHPIISRSISGDTSTQKGFGVPGALGAIALLAVFAVGLEPTISHWRATPRVNQAAAHMEQISLGAASYIKDRYADLTSTLPLNGAATTITLATLKDAGYISPALGNTNPYGHDYSLRVRYVTQGAGANARAVLEPMVVSQGGHPIPDRELLRIAEKMDAGGSIRSDSPDSAIGNNGGWQVQLADFGGSPGAGHLAVGMFYSDAGMLADYLYRNSVPGRPEVNRMNTDIDMAGNDLKQAATVETDRIKITAANGQAMWMQNTDGKLSWIENTGTAEVASLDQDGNLKAEGRITTGEYLQIDGTAEEGASCSPDGLVGRTSAGLILSCQSGLWDHSAGMVKYAGSFLVGTGYYGPCASANIKTGTCSCPEGFTARLTGMGGWWTNAPWDSFLTGYSCER